MKGVTGASCKHGREGISGIFAEEREVGGMPEGVQEAAC